jgi:hypothetical protein
VPVRDARKDSLREGARVVDEVRGKGRNASCQGLLLVAGALVGAAEQAVQEFGVRGEQPLVKLGRNFADA